MPDKAPSNANIWKVHGSNLFQITGCHHWTLLSLYSNLGVHHRTHNGLLFDPDVIEMIVVHIFHILIL
jgi:hypothetical protein